MGNRLTRMVSKATIRRTVNHLWTERVKLEESRLLIYHVIFLNKKFNVSHALSFYIPLKWNVDLHPGQIVIVKTPWTGKLFARGGSNPRPNRSEEGTSHYFHPSYIREVTREVTILCLSPSLSISIFLFLAWHSQCQGKYQLLTIWSHTPRSSISLSLLLVRVGVDSGLVYCQSLNPLCKPVVSYSSGHQN